MKALTDEQINDLNKSKGNMFDWITKTYNPLGGECPHKCEYCYVKSNRFEATKKKYSGKPFLNHREANKSLGKDNFIFVCSMIDMFADSIKAYSILKILEQCRKYDNKYLFQSKNPKRFYDFEGKFPKATYLGTTIETNRIYSQMGNTPKPMDRAMALNHHANYFPTMVTVEPIMDFDPLELWNLICICNPERVNIGADSKGHKLSEPSADKIKELIYNLKDVGIEVKLKSNLKRLMGEFPK